jgi:selenocysteine-specific elongation factor
MTIVVGTAGHIDHGKTSLLRALTGIDPDRLPDERRRGMTLDVGYAWLAFDDGTQLDFVDVPGHDRLVGNMLVGAGEIDAAMLVVAADDGPRAQTLEHLELLDGLAIRDGVAVVTKTDLVDEARVAQVATSVERLLAATSLAGSPVVAASAQTGAGLDRVRASLVALRDRVESRGDREPGPARLGIDRVFTIRGRGLVATGTLRHGRIARGDGLRLEPGGDTVRVREVQVHGRTVEVAGPGRVALALAGADPSRVERGMVLSADPGVVVSERMLVALRAAPTLSGNERRLPSDGARLRLHVGTAQVGATVIRSGREGVPLADGEVAAVLRLERPVALAPNDPFVLRRPSPPRTEAGGRVLDVDPPRGASRRRATPERIAALAASRTPDELGAALLAIHGARAGALAPDVAAALVERALDVLAGASDGVRLAALRSALVGELRRRVTIAPPAAALAVETVVDGLVAAGRLVRDGDLVRDPGATVARPSTALLEAMDRLERVLDVAAPPPLGEAAGAAGCPPEGVRALEAAGRLVRVDDDLAWSASAYRGLESRALELAAVAPLAPATLRDATGTSRKYVMALLEDLDRRAVLRRTPEGHVPGPRASVRSR